MYKEVGIFIGGLVVGAAGSLLYLRNDFERKVREEVVKRERVREENARSEEIEKAALEEKDRNAELNRQIQMDNRKAYNGISERFKYSSSEVRTKGENAPIEHSSASGRLADGRMYEDLEIPDDAPVEKDTEPFGISDEEFMYDKEYTKRELTYYRGDGIISDDDGHIIEDVNYILGEDWYKTVGMYGDDAAYIRNLKTGTDYEIVCESRNYKDDFGD